MEYPIISGSSVIIALIGFYLAIRVWVMWKNIDMDVLKARVFLDKKFLEKNWRYVFLTGASLTAHQFLDFLMQLNYIVNGLFKQLSEVLEFLALVFLVILAYEWFTIVYFKKTAD